MEKKNVYAKKLREENDTITFEGILLYTSKEEGEKALQEIEKKLAVIKEKCKSAIIIPPKHKTVQAFAQMNENVELIVKTLDVKTNEKILKYVS